MPGCVRVSVLEAENLPPSVTDGQPVFIRVSIGKSEFQTHTNNAHGGRTSPWNFEFTYRVFNLRDNLVIAILGSTEEFISRSEIRTVSIIERGYWDAYFSFKGGGRIHLKLRFVLTDEERRKVELMRAAALKRKTIEGLVIRGNDQIVRPAAKRGTKGPGSGVTITEIHSDRSDSEKGSGFSADQSANESPLGSTEHSFSLPVEENEQFMSEDHAFRQPASAGSLEAVHPSNLARIDVDIDSMLLLPEVSALMTDLSTSLSPLQRVVEMKENIDNGCQFSTPDSLCGQLASDHVDLMGYSCIENILYSDCSADNLKDPTPGVKHMDIAFEATSFLPSMTSQPGASAGTAPWNGTESITYEASQTLDCSLEPQLSELKYGLQRIETVHVRVEEQSATAATMASENMVSGCNFTSLGDAASPPGESCSLESRGIEQIRSGTVKARILAFEATMQEQVHQVKSSYNQKSEEKSGRKEMKDSGSVVEQSKVSHEASIVSTAQKKLSFLEKVQQWKDLKTQAHIFSHVEQMEKKLEERPMPNTQGTMMVPGKSIDTKALHYNDNLEHEARRLGVAENQRVSIEMSDRKAKKDLNTQFILQQAKRMTTCLGKSDICEASLPPEVENRGLKASNLTDDVLDNVSEVNSSVSEQSSSLESSLYSEKCASVVHAIGSFLSVGRESQTSGHGPVKVESQSLPAGESKQGTDSRSELYTSKRAASFGKGQQPIAKMEPQQAALVKSYHQSDLLSRNGANNRTMHTWDLARPESSCGLRVSEGSKDHKISEGISCRMKQVLTGAALLAGVVILGNEAIQRDLAFERERYHIVKEGDTLCSIIPGQWNNPTSLFYQLNPEISNRDLIYPGQRLRLC